jgi:hypothetical protein
MRVAMAFAVRVMGRTELKWERPAKGRSVRSQGRVLGFLPPFLPPSVPL